MKLLSKYPTYMIIVPQRHRRTDGRTDNLL